MSQRTWLMVKGTPVWVYKWALIISCISSYLIYSYFIYYLQSYMDYYIIFQVFWIILVWANFVRLIWYQSFVLDPGLWPVLIRPCLNRLLANPFISELLRSQSFWPKIGFWPFKYSEFLWLSWSLTIIGLLAKHKIFRVSLNRVLDHNLTFGHTKFFWSFSQPRSLTRNPHWPHWLWP